MKSIIIALSLFSQTGLQASTMDALVERSPFVPDGYRDPNRMNQEEQNRQPERPQDWAFRGWSTIGDQTRVSLYNMSEKKGYWVKLNDPSAAVRVLNIDRQSRNVSVSINGRTEVLSLAESNLTAAAGAVQARPAARPAPPQPLEQQINPENNEEATNQRRVIPRRRVIVPRRDN